MHKLRYLGANWLGIKLNNEELRRRLGNVIRGVVYDLGCGTRPYEKEILAVADRYIGVDWPNTVHGLHADIVANLNKPLPIDNNVADSVILLQVLEHLCEPRVVLSEAFRILKRGGSIYVTVPFQWWVHEAPHDYFRYTRHGLEHLLSQAGFVDVVVTPSTGFWTMWFLKFNYQTARYVRGPRPIRIFARLLLIPLWFAGQVVAPFLDRVDFNDTETAGYYATARKL